MARIPNALIDAIAPVTDEMARIRAGGIGSNFTVTDPEDGYRKNNQVWFGTCGTCGERVTSSRFDNGVWMHKLVTAEHPEFPSMLTHRNLDRCPQGDDRV